jgi:simple sugar transport system permease protein
MDASLVGSALRLAVPIYLAALGGIFSERSGVINVFLEGLMLTGAFVSVAGTLIASSLPVGCATALATAILLGALYWFLTVKLRYQQIIVGLGLNLAASGVTSLLSQLYFGGTTTTSIPRSLPMIAAFAGGRGRAYAITFNWLDVAALAAACAATFFLFRMTSGLRLRMCGENPRAASSLAVPVARYRLAAQVACAVLACLGGMYMSLSVLGAFRKDMIAGRGFIALGALILGRWHPLLTLAAALFFGLAEAVSFRLQGAVAYSQLVQMIPYVATVLFLAFLGKRAAAPQALGA